MSEYTYHYEIDLNAITDEYAKKLTESVNEMTLDKAADTLARYGYVKVVRCRDCKHYEPGDNEYCVPRQCLALGFLLDDGYGFCSWGDKAVER